MKHKHFLEALNTLNDGGSQHLKHQSSQSHFGKQRLTDVTLIGTAAGDWGKPTTTSCVALFRFVGTSHERSK